MKISINNIKFFKNVSSEVSFLESRSLKRKFGEEQKESLSGGFETVVRG